jgi:hypothetical protein
VRPKRTRESHPIVVWGGSRSTGGSQAAGSANRVRVKALRPGAPPLSLSRCDKEVRAKCGQWAVLPRWFGEALGSTVTLLLHLLRLLPDMERLYGRDPRSATRPRARAPDHRGGPGRSRRRGGVLAWLVDLEPGRSTTPRGEQPRRPSQVRRRQEIDCDRRCRQRL